MTFAVILIIVVAVLEVAMFFYIINYASEVAERELTLDKQEVSLEEREQRNKEDFLALADMEGEYKEFLAIYAVSDSDIIRYSTETAMLRNVKKHLAFTLANDILHSFEPDFDGKIYSLKIKVKK